MPYPSGPAAFPFGKENIASVTSFKVMFAFKSVCAEEHSLGRRRAPRKPEIRATSAVILEE